MIQTVSGYDSNGNANPIKPYDLAFEVRENYLYAFVSGRK